MDNVHGLTIYHSGASKDISPAIPTVNYTQYQTYPTAEFLISGNGLGGIYIPFDGEEEILGALYGFGYQSNTKTIQILTTHAIIFYNLYTNTYVRHPITGFAGYTRSYTTKDQFHIINKSTGKHYFCGAMKYGDIVLGNMIELPNIYGHVYYDYDIERYMCVCPPGDLYSPSDATKVGIYDLTSEYMSSFSTFVENDFIVSQEFILNTSGSIPAIRNWNDTSNMVQGNPWVDGSLDGLEYAQSMATHNRFGRYEYNNSSRYVTRYDDYDISYGSFGQVIAMKKNEFDQYTYGSYCNAIGVPHTVLNSRKLAQTYTIGGKLVSQFGPYTQSEIVNKNRAINYIQTTVASGLLDMNLSNITNFKNDTYTMSKLNVSIIKHIYATPCCVNGTIYVVDGIHGAIENSKHNTIISDRLETYIPPTSIMSVIADDINNKIIVLYGILESSPSNWKYSVYDIKTNTWGAIFSYDFGGYGSHIISNTLTIDHKKKLIVSIPTPYRKDGVKTCGAVVFEIPKDAPDSFIYNINPPAYTIDTRYNIGGVTGSLSHIKTTMTHNMADSLELALVGYGRNSYSESSVGGLLIYQFDGKTITQTPSYILPTKIHGYGITVEANDHPAIVPCDPHANLVITSTRQYNVHAQQTTLIFDSMQPSLCRRKVGFYDPIQNTVQCFSYYPTTSWAINPTFVDIIIESIDSSGLNFNMSTNTITGTYQDMKLISNGDTLYFIGGLGVNNLPNTTIYSYKNNVYSIHGNIPIENPETVVASKIFNNIIYIVKSDVLYKLNLDTMRLNILIPSLKILSNTTKVQFPEIVELNHDTICIFGYISGTTTAPTIVYKLSDATHSIIAASYYTKQSALDVIVYGAFQTQFIHYENANLFFNVANIYILGRNTSRQGTDDIYDILSNTFVGKLQTTIPNNPYTFTTDNIVYVNASSRTLVFTLFQPIYKNGVIDNTAHIFNYSVMSGVLLKYNAIINKTLYGGDGTLTLLGKKVSFNNVLGFGTDMDQHSRLFSIDFQYKRDSFLTRPIIGNSVSIRSALYIK